MINNCHNEQYSMLSENNIYKEILYLALENLERKNGAYYTFIKEYILNYEKINTNINSKIKKIIIFIQGYTKATNEKKALKVLDSCLNKMKAVKNKSRFIRLYSICIKYDESEIIDTISKFSY